MNYIKRLEADNAGLRERERLDNTAQALIDFRVFLNSPKFVGTETDGGRKDWISTGDVTHRLMDIRDTLNGLA